QALPTARVGDAPGLPGQGLGHDDEGEGHQLCANPRNWRKYDSFFSLPLCAVRLRRGRQNGLVVYTEIPLVDTPVNDPDATQVSEGTVRYLLQQVEEMVKQNFNHPCVAFWGMANEIGFIRRFTPKLERASTEALLARMRSVVHALDPSRPTIQADVGGQPPYSKEEDTVALNRYYGWYDPDL